MVPNRVKTRAALKFRHHQPDRELGSEFRSAAEKLLPRRLLGVDAAHSTLVREGIATTHRALYRHLKTKTLNQSKNQKSVTRQVQALPKNKKSLPIGAEFFYFFVGGLVVFAVGVVIVD